MTAQTPARPTVFLALMIALTGAGTLFFPRSAAAATRVWDGGGATNDWSEAANWSGDVVPNLNDVVTFDGTSTKDVTIDAGGPQAANINIGILQISAGYTGTITLAPGVNVRLSVDFNQSEPLSTFAGSNGDLDVQQNFFLSGGTFMAPSGRLLVGASFTHSAGSFLHNNGTVVFDTFFGNITVPGSETFNNVTFGAVNQDKTIANGGTLIVLGTLTLADGSITAGAIEAQGDVVHQSTFDGGSTNIRIVQPTTRTITFVGGGRLPNVALNSPHVTIDTTGIGTVVMHNFTLQAGTVEQGAVAFSLASLGSFAQSGGAYNGGSGALTVDFRFTMSGGTFAHGSGLLRVNDLFNISNGTFSGGSGDIDINQGFTLSGGTFTATSGRMFLGANFTHTAGGSFFHNNGTAIFDNFPSTTIDVNGSETFDHVSFNVSKNIAAGDTLTVLGTLTLGDGLVSGGTLSLHGNVVISSFFDGGTARVTFSGAGAQTYMNSGGINPGGIWTLNKSAGKVTLASDLTLGTGQALNITSGTLDLGASFNLSAGAITIGAAGTLRNFGSGNFTLGGSLVNNGMFNFNGGGTGCGDGDAADPLLIRSSQTGTARNWSGNGAFSIVDANVQDQNGSAIAGGVKAFASVNSGNNSNWMFDAGCPVQITTQPVHLSVCPGAAASFAVGATGDTLTFQWRKGAVALVDGGNISGATAAALAINPAADADVGSYDVVAANRFGVTATSSAAILMLLAAPGIVLHPSNARTCESEPVTFSVSAIGDGLFYQWRKDGNAISGATANTFSLGSVAPGDAGIYDVVVGGMCSPSVVSAGASLAVNTAPAIITQPADQQACEGGAASFSVVAAGTDTTFQWYRDGILLSDGGRIRGANTNTLVVDDIAAEDAGSYSVVVGGLCSPVAASVAVNLRVSDCSGGGLITFEGIPGVTAMSPSNQSPVSLDAGLSTQLQVSDGVSFSSISGSVAVVNLGRGHATSGANGIGGVDSSNLLDYNAPIVITFSMPGSASTPAVTDFASIRGDLHPGSGSATMEAFDVSGGMLGRVTAADVAGGLTLSLALPGIHSIRLTQTQADIAYDDLRFHALSPASVPGSSDRPTADAGDDQPVAAGRTVMLDGSGSSDDNTATEDLIFAWTLTGKPAGSAATLAGAETVHPSLLADLPGKYIVSLVVTDADGLSSDADTVVISSTNTPPVASAGTDKGAIVGSPVALDGSPSYDPDGNPITFSWTLAAPEGGDAALTGETTAFPTFTPNVPGIYTATLMVSDSFGAVSTDSVVVSVISATDFAAGQIASALNVVGSLTLGQVTTRGNRQALQNFLNQAIAAIQAGDLEEARIKIAQAIERTDGCVIHGSPDQNGSGRDWIIDCGAQTVVYETLGAALTALRR